MPRLSRPSPRRHPEHDTAKRSRAHDETQEASSSSSWLSGILPKRKKGGTEGEGAGGGFRMAAMSIGDFDLKSPKAPKWQQALWVMLTPPGHPDKRRLMTVQDFFRYTEEEGKKFFDELDSDGDGRVSLDDMKVAMRKRKLPEKYAYEFLRRARGPKWWNKSIGWEEFKMAVDERESEVLRAFTSLKVNNRGRVEMLGIKDSLEGLGLPASEDNAFAMLRALDSEQDGFVSYGKFRNFAILLPKHKLQDSVDPSIAWFESATMVPLGPVPAPSDNTGKMLLTAALAGGLASGLSTFLMHPVDTLKTRVQSTVGVTIVGIVKSVPKIGAVSLYRGVVPATAGSGLSHGLRTCAYEGSLKILTAFTGGAAELQMQGLASGLGTLLGTCVRIPCEVLKQRLQVGSHDNAQEALATALRVDGPKGLFRGTAATLAREVPFYMFGMMFYQVLKKVFRGEMFGGEGRDLKPWQTVMVGALSGAMGAIVTTPADVLKTRIMTAEVGSKVAASQILIDILKAEGIPALFKGCLPRAVWIAPLGAMNFAGYELAKNALTKDQREQKKLQEEANAELEEDGETEGANPPPEPSQKRKPFWKRESDQRVYPEGMPEGVEIATSENIGPGEALVLSYSREPKLNAGMEVGVSDESGTDQKRNSTKTRTKSKAGAAQEAVKSADGQGAANEASISTSTANAGEKSRSRGLVEIGPGNGTKSSLKEEDCIGHGNDNQPEEGSNNGMNAS
ncbi:hypothetical protein BSKO_03488 [Bryopsis sp. KO-2023]|nr:hypothetical protein BSKO_03488 [Bryopsis sp. KO-2023]